MSINISASTLLNQLNSTGAYSYSTTKEKRTLNETKVSSKDNCAAFTKALRNLRKLDISAESDKTTAKKYIKNFISSLNSLTDAASELNSKALDRRFSKINSLISNNSEELSKLGISKNSSGKLTFDKLTFDEFEDSDVYDSLFGKSSDFSKKIEKYMKSVKSMVSNNIVQTSNVTTTTTVNVDSKKISMANSCNMLSTYANQLNSATDSNTGLNFAQEIISNFNNIFISEKDCQTKSELLNSLASLVQENSDELNEIGIEVSADGKTLSFSSDVDSDGNDGKVKFVNNYDKVLSLFGGSFGSKLSDISNNLFCELLETSKNNINIYA